MHPLCINEANGGHIGVMLEEVRIFPCYWWERRTSNDVPFFLNLRVNN